MVKSALSVTERRRRGDGGPWMDGVVVEAVIGRDRVGQDRGHLAAV